MLEGEYQSGGSLRGLSRRQREIFAWGALVNREARERKRISGVWERRRVVSS